VIESFKCKETKRIFDRDFSKKFPNDIQRFALRKLRMLNRAKILKDYWCPQEIDWRFYAVVVKVSTVFVLIINGEFAMA